MFINWLHNVDVSLFYFINQGLRNSFFDILMPIASNLIYFIVPILFLLIFIIVKYRKRGFVLMILTILVITTSDQLTSSLIKPLIGRYRPCNERGDIHLNIHKHWIETPSFPGRFYKSKKSFSFPSSHAANTFAVATLWLCFLGTPYILLFLFALIVAFSRVYLGVHYPLDVIGGAVIGTICGLFWFLFYKDVILKFISNKKLKFDDENLSF